MKCNRRFIKLFAILILGFAVINLSLDARDNAVNPHSAQFVSDSRALNDGHFLPLEVWGTSSNNQASEPLAYLFQIIFILFFISPPLIVILLFFIWKELKERNKMK